MRVLICPNAFKGSLTAAEAAAAIARGIRRQSDEVELVCRPVADGGDGTLAVIMQALGGRRLLCETWDPLGRPLEASYGVLPDGRAVVELAQASGLARLAPEERDPERTSTYGTGVLIGKALTQGVNEVWVTLGGSATNDGGVGIAQALGFRFLDPHGQELPFGGGSLVDLATIDILQVRPAVWRTRFQLLCDVSNPLLGSQGASAVFGPQKGATPAQQVRLELGLSRLAAVIEAQFGVDIRGIPGAGAAGGAGGGLVGLLGATLTSGTDFILTSLDLSREIDRADLVITGEGQLDPQSQMGKVFGRILDLCQTKQKPLWVIVGQGSQAGVKVSEVMSLAPTGTAALQGAARYVEELAALGIREFLHPPLQPQFP